jgi:hypothetical protein
MFDILEKNQMKPNRNPLSLLVAAAFCASSTCAALAEPITYTFTAEGPITGTLGGVAIGGTTGDLPTDVITFTLVSDTSDVQPFTLGPVHGFENLVGAASITVTDYSTGSVMAQGTFLPSDGIFVSIDNVNGGVGFGSDGASPSDPGFPRNPAYPFALVPDDDPAVFTYDLQSNIAFNSLSSLSCLGFQALATLRPPSPPQRAISFWARPEISSAWWISANSPQT